MNQDVVTADAARRIAKTIVKATRDHVLVTKTKMTDIAKISGLNRMTVSKNLDSDDITLNLLISSWLKAGGNLGDCINQAIQTEKASDATEARVN